MTPARALGPALLALGLGSGAAAAQPFSWDALGAAFCARSTAGDIAGLRPLLSVSLVEEIERAFALAPNPLPPTLFQSYVNRVPGCVARTRNAAIVEIRRSGPGGGAPSWTEYLVMTPEPDGSTRVDDVLFATARRDTLRARLMALTN